MVKGRCNDCVCRGVDQNKCCIKVGGTNTYEVPLDFKVGGAYHPTLLQRPYYGVYFFFIFKKKFVSKKYYS